MPLRPQSTPQPRLVAASGAATSIHRVAIGRRAAAAPNKASVRKVCCGFAANFQHDSTPGLQTECLGIAGARVCFGVVCIVEGRAVGLHSVSARSTVTPVEDNIVAAAVHRPVFSHLAPRTTGATSACPGTTTRSTSAGHCSSGASSFAVASTVSTSTPLARNATAIVPGCSAVRRVLGRAGRNANEQNHDRRQLGAKHLRAPSGPMKSRKPKVPDFQSVGMPSGAHERAAPLGATPSHDSLSLDRPSMTYCDENAWTVVVGVVV
jgi:hypothetical protein